MFKIFRITSCKKLGSLFLVLLISFYLGGISYFYHIHIVDGIIVAHSYPCVAHHDHHAPFSENHHDSHCCCNFENDPSIFFSDEFSIDFYDLNPHLFFLNNVSVDINQTLLVSSYLKNLSLRAPPSIYYFL